MQPRARPRRHGVTLIGRLATTGAVAALSACGTVGPILATPDAPPPSTIAGGSATYLVAYPIGSVEGAPLGFWEFVPPDAADAGPPPLLVFLHGGGENGDGGPAALERVKKPGPPAMIAANDWPLDRPFIVLMPQYPPEVSDACSMAEEVAAFLDFAVERYAVDPSRVYLTGISCGAIGAWSYLAAHGDELVAAAVPVAGHVEDAIAIAGCDLNLVPVWAFHGAQDEIVPPSYMEDRVAELDACTDPAPVDLTLTVYPETDHVGAIAPTYDLSAGHDIYTWMLEHTRD